MIKKYSIGGQIIEIKDKDGIEIREAVCNSENACKIIICSGCGIQHGVGAEKTIVKCGCGKVTSLN
jgi:hypothetical protein